MGFKPVYGLSTTTSVL